MKKQFLFLSTLVFGALSVFAQTPYDNFAPEQNVKSMIELPQAQFKVANTDTNSEIRYIEFDKSSLSLILLDNNENVLKILVLNPNEKKFTSIDPLAEKYYSISPYAYCANNPINAVDLRGDSITTVINTTITNPDGTTSVQSDKYYYGQDANGNYVEPFIIDGTTYLPVRGISNALNLGVGWDGENNTVKSVNGVTASFKIFESSVDCCCRA